MVSQDLLATKQFRANDQELFAELSGDRNPMHLDAIEARRTSAGAPVVHGVHLVLWALETLFQTISPVRPVSSLNARFLKFAYVGEAVSLFRVEQDLSKIRLKIVLGNMTLATMTLGLGERDKGSDSFQLAELAAVALSPQPVALAFEDIRDRSGWVSFAQPSGASMTWFPATARQLGAAQIAALAASSHLVGMTCPGLHSMFVGFKVQFVENISKRAGIGFKVTAADARTKLLYLEIWGSGLSGSVEALYRRPPAEQPPLTGIQQLVAAGEFKGARALIVGGSRGLGELTAKIVAAGGGDITLTYASGLVDVQRVASEIKAAGGRCEILQYDARKAPHMQIASLKPVNQIYYFATDKIFRRKQELFEPELFAQFSQIYSTGFYQLCRFLLPRSLEGLSVFYPSTVAIDECHATLAEYSMAKTAGEVLCANMQRFMPQLRILVTRLPGLLTDQAPAMMASKFISPLEVMLPIVRQVHSAGTRAVSRSARSAAAER
jgi:hypothetical protein